MDFFYWRLFRRSFWKGCRRVRSSLSPFPLAMVLTLITLTYYSAGGQDYQTVLPSNHPSAPLSAQLSTQYLLKTDPNESTGEINYIKIQTKGWRTGPSDVMLRLSQAASSGIGFETVKVPGPEEYKFRLFVEMEVSLFFIFFSIQEIL